MLVIGREGLDPREVSDDLSTEGLVGGRSAASALARFLQERRAHATGPRDRGTRFIGLGQAAITPVEPDR
jgi:hypothetical protein